MSEDLIGVFDSHLNIQSRHAHVRTLIGISNKASRWAQKRSDIAGAVARKRLLLPKGMNKRLPTYYLDGGEKKETAS